jgi:outer membrane protein assembly factor BamA
VRANYKGSFLKKGARIDVTNLKKERDRIENVCRNSGYFLFNREYVTFDYDSFAEDKSVTIKIILNHPNDAAEHVQFYLNNIYIISDYSVDLGDTIHRDTVTLGDYKFISASHKFRNKILAESIFFKKNELYSKDAEVQTINHLSQLGVFKFISVDYSKPKDRDGNYLDCTLQLTPAKKQVAGVSPEIYVSTEGLFGASGTLNYKNKNLTKRADQLLVDLSAGIQIRFPTEKAEKVQIMSVTAAVGVTYYMNKFLVPFRAKIFSAKANPKTRFSVNYNFDNQFDFDATGKNVVFLYQLHNFNAAFGYEWNKGTQQHHLLNPITVDFFLLPKVGSDFTARLDSNPPLKSSFEEQVIIGPSYTFTYNNSKSNTDRKYMKLRIALETAGNVIDGVFKAASNNTEHDSIYEIANKPFAQYFRMEVDWSNFLRMNNHSQFCIRTYAGVGVPYGNSFTLPFIKQFFVGGPNSLRGFQIREIGPGSYVPDTTVFNPETGKKTDVGFFNQTGDIKLETNAEIRFDIYKWLKGALFTDAGNVWTLKKDAVPNGQFNFNTFWSQFAVDAGAGLRLDFSYFVIRFDYGFPLRDPRRVVGEMWQFKDGVAFKYGVFQLAIGYPF